MGRVRENRLWPGSAVTLRFSLEDTTLILFVFTHMYFIPLHRRCWFRVIREREWNTTVGLSYFIYPAAPSLKAGSGQPARIPKHTHTCCVYKNMGLYIVREGTFDCLAYRCSSLCLYVCNLFRLQLLLFSMTLTLCRNSWQHLQRVFKFCWQVGYFHRVWKRRKERKEKRTAKSYIQTIQVRNTWKKKIENVITISSTKQCSCSCFTSFLWRLGWRHPRSIETVLLCDYSFNLGVFDLSGISSFFLCILMCWWMR